MHPDIEPVRRLHALDNRILDIAAEIKSLPEELAKIEATLAGNKASLEAAKDRVAANQKARRQHETNITDQDAKIIKLKGQMGEAKTNEQYHAFQHEIRFAEDAISDAETGILELMEEAEALSVSVAQAEKALAAETADVEKQKTATRERVDEDKAALATTKAERETEKGAISADGIRAYDKARKRLGRRAVAEIEDGHCGSCKVVVRPAFLQELHRQTKLMNCESCSCLLFEPVIVATEDPAGEHNIA